MSRARHSKRQERSLAVSGWLGAGAATVGLGVALLSGAGVAHADDAGHDTSSAHSDASSNGGGDSGGSSPDRGSASGQKDRDSDGSDSPGVGTGGQSGGADAADAESSTGGRH